MKDSSVAVQTGLAFTSVGLPVSPVIAATEEKCAHIVAVPLLLRHCKCSRVGHERLAAKPIFMY